VAGTADCGSTDVLDSRTHVGSAAVSADHAARPRVKRHSLTHSGVRTVEIGIDGPTAGSYLGGSGSGTRTCDISNNGSPPPKRRSSPDCVQQPDLGRRDRLRAVTNTQSPLLSTPPQLLPSDCQSCEFDSTAIQLSSVIFLLMRRTWRLSVCPSVTLVDCENT